MINRHNWELTQKYLKYRAEIDLLAEDSLKQEIAALRYVLEWAQETPLIKASEIRPTLPEYLSSSRPGAAEHPFTRDYVKRLLTKSQRFFQWLIDYEKGYTHLGKIWIKKLRIPTMVEVPREKEAVLLDEILVMAKLPVHSIQEQRIQAMACFLYLSGMRIGAFVSMPLLAVDIERRTVYQHPELGIKTKNKKHATTFLIEIPELLAVANRWDQYVRSQLPENGYWFAPLHPRTGDIDVQNLDTTQTRRSLARRGLLAWCEKNNIKYHNPHEFRHGHIHYGMKLSKGMEDFKSVSMNAMHSNIGITDQYYSVISQDERKSNFAQLGKPTSSGLSDDEILNQIQALLARKQTR